MPGSAPITGSSGAANVADGARLRGQLTGEELAGADAHAFAKHVIERGEFPGIRTRDQFASMVEDVVSHGEMRPPRNGRTGYWRNGVVVIRNPNAADGGIAFAPKGGYDYFLNDLQ